MPASRDEPWVAVMIDGENIAATLLPTIMSTAKQYGDLRIRRVYGAMGAGSNLQAWEKDAPRYGLQLCHVPHTANKKNGTDIALVVDTMLLLAAEAFDVLCLVANDSDYIPLIRAVHASSRPVVGMSAHPSADIVQQACTKYHPLTAAKLALPVVAATATLPAPAAPKPPAPAPPVAATAPAAPAAPVVKPAPPAATASATPASAAPAAPVVKPAPPAATAPAAPVVKPAPPTPLKPAPSIHTYSALEALLIKAWLAGKKSSDGWMDLPTLGSALRQVEPGFTSKLYGYSTLTQLVQAHTRILEIQVTQNKLLIRRRVLSRVANT